MSATPTRNLLQQWKSTPGTAYRLVGYGSSNTEMFWHSQGRHTWFCWVSIAVRASIGRHITAINAGISGETTRNLLSRMPSDLGPLHPSLVIVTIGGNDQWAMSPDEFHANLTQVVTRLRALGAQVALQTYYCPMLDAAGLRHFDVFMDTVRLTASETGAGLIDHYDVLKRWWGTKPDEYREIMLDAMHLNPFGNAVFGALCAETLGCDTPVWPEADKARIEGYLAGLKALGAP